jgi:penicillin-binding protein 1A
MDPLPPSPEIDPAVPMGPRGLAGQMRRLGGLLRRWIRPLPLWSVWALAALACLAGVLAGYSLNLDLPNVSSLQDYQPPVITRLYSDTGVLVHQYAEERRILVPLQEIPETFRNAIIATEDADFYRHWGISPKGIARAFVYNLLAGSVVQGGSTLTQQLAKILFLRPERTLRRKAQEAYLALQIEKSYTKQEILEFYCNQIYMGHGRYGIEAASQFYFGKPSRDLTLAEAATLAGIPQRPEVFSPLRNPEVARRKRDHVLDRMVEEGYLDEETAAAAKAEPVVTLKAVLADPLAPYFVEEVRRRLEADYGEDTLYKGGLEVFTTLNIDIQKAANAAVRKGLHAIDKRQGFRPVERNLLRENAGLDAAQQEALLASHQEPDWQRPPEPGRLVRGLVLQAGDRQAEVRVGEWTGRVLPADVSWTGRRTPREALSRGDLTLFEVVSIDESKKTLRLKLDQEPKVEGALVALDPSTGEVKAMVGGYDFNRSEFNRATQALRQSGSAFKPIVFLSALVHGLTPADLVLDAPTVFTSRRGEDQYQPENYTRRYYGLTTLREALEDSRNIVSVRLLNQIGYRGTIELARRLGIRSPLHAFPSTALGSSEVTLLELVSAFSVFPNQGIRVEPHLVKYVASRDGRVLEKTEPEAVEAISADLAYLMTYLLEGVIADGTGRLAKVIDHPMAGKTGTTDDFSDAWFIGFTPSLACGVWVGFDQKQSLGPDETGARAALPIWVDFFRTILKDQPRERFLKPANVVYVPIDRQSGLRASVESGCKEVILEAFVRGTEPTAFCSAADHFRQDLPYFLQELKFNERQELVLSPAELLRLLIENPAHLSLARNHRALILQEGDQERVIALEVSEEGGPAPSGTRSFAPSIDRPVGVDGQLAAPVPVSGG